MNQRDHDHTAQPRCCPCSSGADIAWNVTRRGFLGSAALGSLAMTGMTWNALAKESSDIPQPAGRRALRVKPILAYSTPQRREKWSWRSWGGIQTEAQAQEEITRIEGELKQIKQAADFPVEFLPIAKARNKAEMATADLEDADTIMVYAAGGSMDILNAVGQMEQDVIFFCRHKSGPVYLWYEIISPRYLRQHTDQLKVAGIDENDVVIDDTNELLWRLRSLCGLKNTRQSRIVAIGGASGWSTPEAPKLSVERFGLDIQEVAYPELGEMIKEARGDKATMQRARQRASDYLQLPGTTLETKREYVDNAFVLDEIFRRIMHKADCRAITINSCMGTIMPLAETSACLTLSTLNDDGYLAFCESDFVVVPSGILLANISGKPAFLNDPTYPHDNLITLAHCTGPRKMNGSKLEPARILTHFESDYGAAPKVEMPKGQMVTNIIPDFKAERWVGLIGEIVDAPFLDICRDQIDVKFSCDSLKLAQRMPGFHWMTGYGDYSRELGYALKKTPIQWELLS
jgi:hypothetical protein